MTFSCDWWCMSTLIYTHVLLIVYIFFFLLLLLFPVAWRSNEYAALQSALLTRKLPDEILFLSWSFMATVELCGWRWEGQYSRVRSVKDTAVVILSRNLYLISYISYIFAKAPQCKVILWIWR